MQTIYELDNPVLRFGEHKGEPLRAVLDKDLGWVKWAYRKSLEDRSFNFRLSDEALEYMLVMAGRAPKAGYRPDGLGGVRRNRR